MTEGGSTDAASERIQQNHRAFEACVAQGRAHLDDGDPLQAAVHAGLAANLATWMHPGLFASGALEQLAVDIGRSVAPRTRVGRPPRPRGGEIRDVLHVISRTLSVGGHTRMIWRWMALDEDRRHSVAVTRQGGGPVPPELVAAAAATGGGVTVLNTKRGSLITWANDLHELATHADVVVLHVDPEDVIPMVAFGDRSDLPPVLYLNHADHIFWLGVGISDLVVNLRQSGHLLSIERRGVPHERNAFMPIALGDRPRTISRAEAKRQLGYPEDIVLMLTIARPVKFEYRSDSGESYIDAVLPVVQELEQVRLVLVGPSPTGRVPAGPRRDRGPDHRPRGAHRQRGALPGSRHLHRLVPAALAHLAARSRKLRRPAHRSLPSPGVRRHPVRRRAGDRRRDDPGAIRRRPSAPPSGADLRPADGHRARRQDEGPTSSGVTSAPAGRASSSRSTSKPPRHRPCSMCPASATHPISARPMPPSRWAAPRWSASRTCSRTTCACYRCVPASRRGCGRSAPATGSRRRCSSRSRRPAQAQARASPRAGVAGRQHDAAGTYNQGGVPEDGVHENREQQWVSRSRWWERGCGGGG